MTDEVSQPDAQQQLLAFLKRAEAQLQLMLEAQALMIQVLEAGREDRRRLQADLRADRAARREWFTGTSSRDP